MQPTILQAAVTKTAAFAGAALAIATIADAEICVKIHDLHANVGETPKAAFTIYDSVDNHVNELPGPHVDVQGPITGGVLPADTTKPVGGGRMYTFKLRDYPSLRFGVTSATIKLKLDSISGTGASCTYSAWINS